MSGPRTVLLGALVGVSLVASACGQDLTVGDDGGSQATCADYPSKDVTLIVGRSPGGGHDEDARFYAPLLEKELGTNVIVENIDGAGGRVAAEEMTTAEPDGYTIHLMEPMGLAALQLVEDTRYDVRKYTHLGRFKVRPTVFAVGGDSEITTFEELVRAGHKRSLRFATAGVSDPNFVNGVIGAKATGMRFVPVPHEGSAEAITSVVRGDTDFTVFSGDTVAEAAEAGDLRGLVQFGQKPLGMLGDVPMARDVGLEELQGELTSALTLEAPPGLPGCVRRPLTRAVQDALANKKLDDFEAEGRIVTPGTPAEAEKVVNQALATYRRYTDVYEGQLTG
ncbi:MAG: tripartite tricarboxylate transporter substrate binding protein [Actinomycetes bacterium]